MSFCTLHSGLRMAAITQKVSRIVQPAEIKAIVCQGRYSVLTRMLELTIHKIIPKAEPLLTIAVQKLFFFGGTY